jgi:outer membrane protein insertion porin family
VGVLQYKRVRKLWPAPVAAAILAVTWLIPALAQVGPPLPAGGPRPAPAPPAAVAPGPPAPSRPTASPAAGTISDIRIEGIQRIEPETVKSYLLLQAGDPWDAERVDSSLKALFATGLFADVKLVREGNTLMVRLVENPIINRIAFEGNSAIADKDLNSEIQLRPRVVYTRTRVQNDVRRILQLYRRHGRFAATVDPKVIQLSENRVDLVFEINEGPSTGVRSINFVGNREFSDSTLRGILETKESRWYRFLSTSDTYDPDRLAYDRS